MKDLEIKQKFYLIEDQWEEEKKNSFVPFSGAIFRTARMVDVIYSLPLLDQHAYSQIRSNTYPERMTNATQVVRFSSLAGRRRIRLMHREYSGLQGCEQEFRTKRFVW